MLAEWQLVNIALAKDGSIVYTFRHRAMFTAGIMSAAVTQTIKTQHPRAGWQIAAWYSEDEITDRERI